VGSYELSVTKDGFAGYTQGPIVLRLNQDADLRIELSLTSVTDKVQVMADASLLNTADAQVGALKQHRREDVYDLSGNHDRSGLDEPQAWWWRKWVDPKGEYNEFSHVDATKRPFPIDGTWERYSFRAGNLLFLMMSDINEPTQKVGRGTLGGNPGGVVSG